MKAKRRIEGPDLIKIDSDVPLPKARVHKYPWRDMKVGDSFFAETPNMHRLAWTAGRAHNMKFAVRKEGAGFRCWRIK